MSPAAKKKAAKKTARKKPTAKKATKKAAPRKAVKKAAGATSAGKAGEGSRAPAFTLPSAEGKVRLSSFRGGPVVVYFYPKDMTSGCTTQACDFRDRLSRIEKAGATVLGISPDSVTRHERFAEKYDLSFPLLADEDHAVAEAYGVWKEKSMYGRKFMGIERSTFLVDGKGVVRRVWRKVKVRGHVDEVLEALADL
jgi:peroxiredoxin Q/BCP